MWPFWFPIAAASPQFVAEVPSDASVARIAWEAAVECAGWEAPFHEEVTISRGFLAGGHLGQAQCDEGGLLRIDLVRELARPEEILVHEVAHAWVKGGPLALTEGRADLLADCISSKTGVAPLPWDDGRDLAGMPDLLAWDVVEYRPIPPAGERTLAALGASRLVRAGAMAVPAPQFWPQSGSLGWDEYRALLKGGGADALVSLLDAGAEAQHRGLSDADRDGLPLVAETQLGTAADRWDSDGDGWWDGAPKAPAGAIPLSPGGGPVCSGWATGPAGGMVRSETGGSLRGKVIPSVAIQAGTERLAGEGGPMKVDGARSLLVSLEANDVVGGAWVVLSGDGLVREDRCQVGASSTVFADDPAYGSAVPQLALALDRVLDRARGRDVPPVGRIVARVGAEPLSVERGVVLVPVPVNGDWDAAAREAVGVQVVETLHGAVDWSVVRAVSGALAP